MSLKSFEKYFEHTEPDTVQTFSLFSQFFQKNYLNYICLLSSLIYLHLASLLNLQIHLLKFQEVFSL